MPFMPHTHEVQDRNLLTPKNQLELLNKQEQEVKYPASQTVGKQNRTGSTRHTRVWVLTVSRAHGRDFSHSADEWNNGLTFPNKRLIRCTVTHRCFNTASKGRDFLIPVCANSGSTVIQLLQSRLTTLKFLVSK